MQRLSNFYRLGDPSHTDEVVLYSLAVGADARALVIVFDARETRTVEDFVALGERWSRLPSILPQVEDLSQLEAF